MVETLFKSVDIEIKGKARHMQSNRNDGIKETKISIEGRPERETGKKRGRRAEKFGTMIKSGWW